MKDHKEYVLAGVKEDLTTRGHKFEEHANGHLLIGKISYWATTGKWYDPETGAKGVGMGHFLSYLHDLELAREKEERWKRLELAAKHAIMFIKVSEQELGEVNHGIPKLKGLVPFEAYDAMHELAKALEYCYLYVDCNIFESMEEDTNA